MPTLDALHGAGHEIVAVYTQPPRPANRGKAPTPSPVHRRAAILGLEVRTPRFTEGGGRADGVRGARTRSRGGRRLRLILPQPILDAPVWDCLNVHASLLPRWRGAAPGAARDPGGGCRDGVTIMAMEAGLDTGDMLAVARTPIDGKDAGALTHELAGTGARLLLDVIADPGAFPPEPQPDTGVTYAAKIDKAETRLDFSRPAIEVERQVRAFAPVPGAWFEHQGERVRVVSAVVCDGAGEPGTTLDDRLLIACGTGSIRPLKVQRAGRGVMATDELLRGFAIRPAPT